MQPRVSTLTSKQERTKAFGLAFVVHLLFVVFLVFGVSWHRSVSSPFEAELWTNLPKAEVAGSKHPSLEPKPQPPEPHPHPEPPKPAPPKVETKPVTQPTKIPPKPAVVPPAVEAAQEKSDIALKRQKKLEEAKARKLAHEKQIKEMMKQEQEEARKELLEDQRRQKAKAAVAKIKALEDKRAEALAQKQAAEQEVQLDAFKIAIIAKIKHHTKVPVSVPTGPSTVVKITVLPDGTVLNKMITQSSGNAAYDEAVLQGIDRSQPLPLPEDIKLRRQFRDLELTFTNEKK